MQQQVIQTNAPAQTLDEAAMVHSIRAAAARRFIATYGMHMLQFAVYDTTTCNYVTKLEG